VRCIRDATEEEEHTFFTSKINHTPTIDPKPLIAEEACNVRTLYLRDKNIEEDRLDAIKAELRNNPDATFDDI
jgi:hypothetical protein